LHWADFDILPNGAYADKPKPQPTNNKIMLTDWSTDRVTTINLLKLCFVGNNKVLNINNNFINNITTYTGAVSTAFFASLSRMCRSTRPSRGRLDRTRCDARTGTVDTNRCWGGWHMPWLDAACGGSKSGTPVKYKKHSPLHVCFYSWTRSSKSGTPVYKKHRHNKIMIVCFNLNTQYFCLL